MVFRASLYGASRMGSIFCHRGRLGDMAWSTESSSDPNHSQTHGQPNGILEMGSIAPGSLIVQSVPRKDGTASPCSGWVRLVSRAAAGEATGVWPGGSLRDPPQSQYIKANVANSHRLVQIKLYNRNLLGRAFMAKEASAVAAVEAKQGGVRGASSSHGGAAMVCLPRATNMCPVESVRTQFQPAGHYSAGGEGSLKTKSHWATARERARSDGPSSSAHGSSQCLGKAPPPHTTPGAHCRPLHHPPAQGLRRALAGSRFLTERGRSSDGQECPRPSGGQPWGLTSDVCES